jgi:cobalt/nickel transport system permease protein
MAVAMVPIWVISVRKVHRELPKEKLPLLGVGAAFSFLAMMFNIPIVGGSTGHAVGGTLIACLLGPYAACLSLSVSLILQALLFGDGGILAIGANCFNMSFVLPFVGYTLFSLIRSVIRGKKGELIGIGVGSYLGINAAALCTALELGIQPLLFTDSAGNALYCPYPLSISIPAMLLEHLTVFGAAELLFSVLVYSFLSKTSPELTERDRKLSRKGIGAVLLLLIGLIAACPLGLLAEGDAWGEWDAEGLLERIGYIPKGIQSGIFSNFSSLFPDYTVGSLPEWLGYILCAVIGVSLLLILFKLLSTFGQKRELSDTKKQKT